jgi:signal transduction histidine kinase
MKRIAGWFWSAPLWRAALEAWLLAAACMALLLVCSPYLATISFFQTITLIGAAAPSVLGLRSRPAAGTRGAVWVLEFLVAALLSVGLILTELLLFFVIKGELSVTTQSSHTPDPLVFGISAGVYLFWRGFRWAWEKWAALRRASLVWSLTHTILVSLVGMVMVAVGAVISLLNGSMPLQFQEGAPELVRVLARLVNYLFYLLLASPFAITPALPPPLALAAYFLARRITRRFDRLEQAAARLSQGDLSARVLPDGEDEIARLQDSFNHMAAELEKASRDLRTQRDRVAALLAAQRELTAAVSHELRTPVATALATLDNDLGRLENLPPDELRRDLEVARHEIERLRVLIDDLFTLARAEVNQLSLDLGPVDLAPLVNIVVQAAAPLAWSQRRVRVQAGLPAGLPCVFADAARVEQVLRNLLANAVRHTPPGGFVVVQAAPGEGQVRVDVIDSGEGIAAADLPHVWERFYRGSGAGEGQTGLGLAIVKELVESMGGMVQVSSERDEGSTFSICLPLE